MEFWKSNSGWAGKWTWSCSWLCWGLLGLLSPHQDLHRRHSASHTEKQGLLMCMAAEVRASLLVQGFP